MISYTIQPLYPEAHLFQVELTVHLTSSKEQILFLPAWIPGSYMIRDFARNIVTIEAWQRSDKIPIEKLDKQTWICPAEKGELTIAYQVYAWDLSVRSAYLDTTRAFFNGTSVFLKVLGKESEPCEVNILPPPGERYRHWKVATTLPRHDSSYYAFGKYHAENYDELIDHPVEIGDIVYSSFEVAGIPHDVVISGRHSTDITRLCNDLKPICEQHSAMFNGLPHIERFLFIVFAVGDGYGGLEHRSSAALICKRDDLPMLSCSDMTEGYRQFLGLCSHEYFHLWNVKRIKPEVFKNPDLSKEVYTTTLWAFEGITSYYDDLALVRSGRVTTESYLELLARQITREKRGSGRSKQTLSESSFDAWIKFYKQDENAPNSMISYYNKGALVALALDLTIRRGTGGEKTLDDVMRYLWQRFGVTSIGVQEDDVEIAATKISGLALGDFFDRHIRNTNELPLADLLESVGVGLQYYVAKQSDDMGGLRDSSKFGARALPVLGARFKALGQDVVLTHVYDGGAAQLAGLSAGDVIVAVSGIRATAGELEGKIARVPEGESILVTAFRRDELMEFQVTPRMACADTCALWLMDDVDQEIQENRNNWLSTVSTH